MTQGCLYIVSIPIGNMGDITYRAVEVLSTISLIACEDTRNCKHLLNLLHIKSDKKFFSFHEHSETHKTQGLINELNNGNDIALVSDAGTPLISDPGYTLVNACIDHNIVVIPIPGCSAFLTALTVSGLSLSRFSFHGFIPKKNTQRVNYLQSLFYREETLIFYESPHRFKETLKSISEIFTDRLIIVVREITKKFETIYRDTAENLLVFFDSNQSDIRGEFVLLIEGYVKAKSLSISETVDISCYQLLQELMQTELPLSEVRKIMMKLTGMKRKEVYELIKKDFPYKQENRDSSGVLPNLD